MALDINNSVEAIRSSSWMHLYGEVLVPSFDGIRSEVFINKKKKKIPCKGLKKEKIYLKNA